MPPKGAAEDAGVAWQTGVWDRMSDVYAKEVDGRFASIVRRVVDRARLLPGDNVLDLGTGTGAAALLSAPMVGPKGRVTGVDISPQMVAAATAIAARMGLKNVSMQEGRGEEIPVKDGSQDVVLACLSTMYVIDRGSAAREIGRVLKPGGRFVSAVWAGPAMCDIVRFQQTAGSFAPAPPVAGVGPGALADPWAWVAQLEAAGVDAHVQSETHWFEFAAFDLAWDVLAGVTTAGLSPDERQKARKAVQDAMWPEGRGPRRFRNTVVFIEGTRRPRDD